MKRIALNGLALLLVAGFVALGSWQLDREGQKRDQLAAAAAALAAEPVPLADAIFETVARDLAGRSTPVRKVAGRASFTEAPPLWLDNQRRGDRVGVRMYCTVRAVGRGRGAFLVDLGWLPLPADRRLPAVACPNGEHALAGLLVPPPSAGIALGPAVVAQADGSLLATRIDAAAIAAARGDRSDALLRRVLRLDPALPLGYERDLELLANTLPPEKHRAYALQWFGLATALVVIALVMNFRRKPQS